MTTVLIADDHAVVRSGLRQFLASTTDLKITAEACNGQDVLQQIGPSKCDILLLDINLPDLNGLEVLKRAKRLRPDLPVLVFSMFSEDEFAVHALNAGASGYLNKDSPPAQILQALRTVASGARYLSPALAEKLLSGNLGRGKALPHETLSPRENEVMLALSRGIALTRIAQQLNLSVKTISTYRTRVLEKLNLNSNADITRYVLEHKLDT
ncbi:response regulator [Denitromonas iodatirespirans]|uniref:Response regulator transcription factor n=1 Tax=Denitromonas iodatirespirans TaxID=2795389 RepID=A0A944DES6_DENI1|nr:response regulator transcription factor [Denitromonas iodatirespirans]MBT0961488.1 response regulator transcription factor [Denitromonas iodatirespirans]